MNLKTHKLVIVLLLAQISTACSLLEKPEKSEVPSMDKEVNLAEFFQGIDPNEATFVVYHPSSGQTIRHNAARAQQRFIPASTYKIPNSLIALEAGVAIDLGHFCSPSASGFKSS